MNKNSEGIASFSVTILGNKYDLRARNEEDVKRAAKEVEKLVESYRAKTGNKATGEKLAVLAALELSERVLVLESLLSRLGDHLVEIEKVIDRTLETETSI